MRVDAGAEKLLQRARGGSARVSDSGALRRDGLDGGGGLGPGAEAGAGQHDGGGDEAGDAVVLVLALPALALAGYLTNCLQVDANVADDVLQILLLVRRAEVVAPAGAPVPEFLPHATMAGRLAVLLAVICNAVNIGETGGRCMWGRVSPRQLGRLGGKASATGRVWLGGGEGRAATDWRTLNWGALRHWREGVALVSCIIMTVMSTVPPVPTLVVHAVRTQLLWWA